MRKEGIPTTDPLYVLKNYQEKIKDGCFYSGRPLAVMGHGLDRIDNSKSHTWENTVACCQELNKWANRHRPFEWKVPEGKKMRDYDTAQSVVANLLAEIEWYEWNQGLVLLKFDGSDFAQVGASDLWV